MASGSPKRPIDAEFRATTVSALKAQSEKIAQIEKTVQSHSEITRQNREDHIRASERMGRTDKDLEAISKNIAGLTDSVNIERNKRSEWETKYSEQIIKSRLITGALVVVISAIMSAAFFAFGSAMVKTNFPNYTPATSPQHNGG